MSGKYIHYNYLPYIAKYGPSKRITYQLQHQNILHQALLELNLKMPCWKILTAGAADCSPLGGLSGRRSLGSTVEWRPT